MIFCHDVIHLPSVLPFFRSFKWLIFFYETCTLHHSFKWLKFCYDVMHLPFSFKWLIFCYEIKHVPPVETLYKNCTWWNIFNVVDTLKRVCHIMSVMWCQSISTVCHIWVNIFLIFSPWTLVLMPPLSKTSVMVYYV